MLQHWIATQNSLFIRGGVPGVALEQCWRLTWLPEGHVVPFLEVGRPQSRRLADPQPHRPAEHRAADQRAVSPRPRRHTITSTL